MVFYRRSCVSLERHYILPQFFSLERHLSQVIKSNSTTLCHMFGTEPHLKLGVQNLGCLPLKRGTQPKTAFFRALFRDIETGYRQV